MGRVRYRLRYAPLVKQHLRTIDKKYHSLIRRTIQEQLQYEPNVETRNRKPLRRGSVFDSQWEIRCGPGNRLRVFYEVDENHREVAILAIGVKERSRLLIGGNEVET